MRLFRKGSEGAVGTGEIPCCRHTPWFPRVRKVDSLRRQLAKTTSLISLQNETAHRNLEFVWLNVFENHTLSAHHNFKQTENAKNERQNLQSFPKEDSHAISKVLRGL